MRPVMLLAFLLVAACGGENESDDGGARAGTPPHAETESEPGATGGGSSSAAGGNRADRPRARRGDEEGCDAAALPAGTHEVTLEHDGIARSYLLHVPTGYTAGQATPLVLNFHGLGSNPQQQEVFSQMGVTSDEHGFVVAYPAGLWSSWNAGACCGTAALGLTDDVGFARAVVADVSSKLCIDDNRVYSTGMSNGGYLSHRNGCESADLFAAIAPVAGVIGIPQEDCKPSRPMPVIHFYGTADALVPYAGDGVLGSPSVADTDAGWAARNGCTGTPAKAYQHGAVHCETHETCKAGTHVTLCTVEGGGHCWPGQATCPFGPSTTDISANETMWDFFQGFSLP